MLQTTNPQFISANNFDLVQTFCILNDFFLLFESENKSKRGKKPSLRASEIATITLIGLVYECGCLKSLYKLLRDRFKSEFNLPKYQNFVCLMNKESPKLLVILGMLCKLNNKQSGIITYCDSTKLEVCKIYREKKHREP
jgi:hypothetical protein